MALKHLAASWGKREELELLLLFETVFAFQKAKLGAEKIIEMLSSCSDLVNLKKTREVLHRKPHSLPLWLCCC